MFLGGCPCCCPRVGFERGAPKGVTHCCTADGRVLDDNNQFSFERDMVRMDIAQFADKLSGCAALFTDPMNACLQATRFNRTHFPIIRAWLEDGGRLFVGGEYGDCLDNDEQLPNRQLQNAFVAAMGGTMTIGEIERGCNDSCGQLWRGVVNGAVPLIQNGEITAIYHAATNEVVGGIPLANTNEEDGTRPGGRVCMTPFTFIAIEPVGRGFIILCGDSNVVTGCEGSWDASNVSNCRLFKAFIRLPSDQIL